MRGRLFSAPIDQLNALVVAALVVLILSHIPASYESYKIRHRVLAGLDQANKAKELILANALKGEALAEGWADYATATEAVISIDPYSGIITVT